MRLLGKLVYFKWMVEDAKVLKENLSTEQIGELFVAVMDYLQTGTIKEVSKDIRFPYADYRNKVDRACASYDETCAKRAESGKKGGKAKAENAAKAVRPVPDQSKTFKPPTLSQFKNAVERIIDDNEWESADAYDIERFYDKLREDNWQFAGMAIQSRSDWEEIITAKFHDLPDFDEFYIRHYDFISHLVATYPQLHHRWNDIWNVLDSLFEECWECHDRTWNVRGSVFKYHDWKAALDALVTERIEEIPP